MKRISGTGWKRPKFTSLYAYLDGALFVPAPCKDKNWQGTKVVGR